MVFNPRAARARRWRDRLREAFDARTHRWCETEGPGHAQELARDAAFDGAALVLIGGGDGTIHETVNGLVDVDRAVPFYPLPLGAGNDLVRSLGLPLSVSAALRGLAGRHVRPLDAGRVNGREVFVNVAGFGLDAEVARRRSGRSYTGAVIRVFWSYEPGVLEVAGDDAGARRAFRGRALSVSVANGAFVGGGYRIAPDADPRDGRFDICVIEPVGRLRFARWVGKVRRGRHGNLPVFHTWRASRVTIRGGALACHLDGEYRAFPAESEVTIEMLPGALRVLA